VYSKQHEFSWREFADALAVSSTDASATPPVER
jgi:hypothetical protein